MRSLSMIALSLFVLLGCNNIGSIQNQPQESEKKGDLPSVKPAESFPIFAEGPNEVQIADSFNEVDPTFVIGALVNVKNGTIYALDSYLTKNPKLVTLPLKEIAFKDFVEDSVVANAQWLSFLKGQVNAKCKAEVLVAKSSKVTTPISSIDVNKLRRELEQIPVEKRQDFGLVIGYIDYLISASMFRDYGAEGKVSGYGAQIGATWYSKAENLNSEHRLIAIWSPLPFIVSVIADKAAPGGLSVELDLEKATMEAIKNGQLTMAPLLNATVDKF